jgi:HK97 family phage portal protein
MARAKKPTKKELEERAITYEQGVAYGLVDTPTYSGMHVNEHNAIGLNSLWCGMRVIAEDTASLPLHPWNLDDNDHATKAKSHRLYLLLNKEPNNEMTKPVFWETITACAILFGNAYAEIQVRGNGDPVALWPIHPMYVRCQRNDDGLIEYQVTSPAGGSKIIPAERMLHFPGLSLQGTVGLSLLQVARQTIGWGLAAQRFGGRMWTNASKLSGMLEATQQVNLSDKAHTNMKEQWRKDSSGDKAGGIGLLPWPFTFKPFDINNNEQLQYTQLLTFYNTEVARCLKLAPSKLFEMGRSTWGNLTEVNRDHAGTSIKPWCIKFEAELERKLFKPEEKTRMKIEFDFTDLLRTDDLTRYQCYAIAGGGKPWMTPQEIRQQENLPPVDPAELSPPAPAPQQQDTQPQQEGTNGN